MSSTFEANEELVAAARLQRALDRRADRPTPLLFEQVIETGRYDEEARDAYLAEYREREETERCGG